MNALESSVSLTDALRAAVGAIIAEHRASAEDEWDRAWRTGLTHARLVALNNPGKTFEAIWNRPDVRTATTVPFTDAATATRTAMGAARAEAWREAAERAADQLEYVTGTRPEPLEVPPRSAVENRAWADVVSLSRHSREAMRPFVEEADWLGADTERRSRARRAGMAVEVVAMRAATEAMVATYEAAGVTQMVWVARFRNNTPCATCVALHGTTVPVGGQFSPVATMAPGKKTPRTWAGLPGPPRHPNCRCSLAPWVPSMKAEPGPTPETMQTFAKSWWRRLLDRLFGGGDA